MYAHLRAGMHGYAGERLLYQKHQAQILNNHGIGTQAVQKTQHLFCHRQFGLLDQGIEGDINPSPIQVRVTDGCRQGFFIKTGTCSGAKASGAEVYGISPILYGGLE